MTSVSARPARARVGLLILTVAIAVAGPMTASAQDADELIKQGNVLRRKGDDSAALEKFEQAYQIDKRPRSLAQMGLAEQALGRWVRAYEHLTQALADKSDPWIARNVAPLGEALKTAGEHVGQLEILGGTRGAEVRVNGTVVGQLPFSKPLTLPIGTATIGLSARGYIPIERATSIRAGQIARESFDPLGPVTDPSAQVAVGRSASTASAPPPRNDATPGGLEPGSVPEASPSDAAGGSGPSTLRLSAKWIAGGLAVLSFAGATVAYLEHQDASDQFAQKCYQDSTGVHPSDASTTVAQCGSLQNAWNSNYRLAIVGVAAGAAFAIAGVALWLTEPAPNDARVARIACAPSGVGSGGFFIGCARSF